MVLHVDMDAFYASVEERERPELKGRAVIVGGDPQSRGVVCAANYEARRFGVHSAMSSRRAAQLCPQAVVLRPRMEFYAGISRQIREIFRRYTPLVEPLSLDEAFLDVSQSTRLFGSEESIGRAIKSAIREETQLVASVGVAPNKFLAKLASDLDKPDGFTIIAPDEIQQRLDPLPVTRIWGVGRATAARLTELGIATIGQLRRRNASELRALFGQHADHFRRLARGIDDRTVVADRDARSISHETTFPSDIEDVSVLRAWLLELTEHVARRLRDNALTAKTVHLKLRYGDFHTITRSRSLHEATSSTRVLWKTAANLLMTELPDRPLVVRLLGMGASTLQPASSAQRRLFDDADDLRDRRIDQVTDEIRARFGNTSLRRASTVEHDANHRALPRPD